MAKTWNLAVPRLSVTVLHRRSEPRFLQAVISSFTSFPSKLLRDSIDLQLRFFGPRHHTRLATGRISFYSRLSDILLNCPIVRLEVLEYLFKIISVESFGIPRRHHLYQFELTSRTFDHTRPSLFLAIQISKWAKAT